MIYELRTYDLKPGAVPEFEARFAEALPHSEKYSRLGGFWHTEVGPLNQVVHLWPYESLTHREESRAARFKDPHWPPRVAGLLLRREAEILNAAPFIGPLKSGHLGNFYELQTYCYDTRGMGEALKRWEAAAPHRTKYATLAGCWYTDVGELEKLIALWAYPDLAERGRVREAFRKDPLCRVHTEDFLKRDLLLRQESKLLLPAPFSPMR